MTLVHKPLIYGVYFAIYYSQQLILVSQHSILRLLAIFTTQGRAIEHQLGPRYEGQLMSDGGA